MLKQDVAIKLGVKMLNEGKHINDVVTHFQKKGGVVSKKMGKLLSPASLRIQIQNASKKDQPLNREETQESLREQLTQTRINSAFLDVRMALLRNGKQTFTYEEVRHVLNKVASASV